MSQQLALFGECANGALTKERHGWRASCGCGWASYVVELKSFARDELHAHLRLKLTAHTADDTV